MVNKPTKYQINKASKAINILQNVVRFIWLHEKPKGFNLAEVLPTLSKNLEYMEEIYNNPKLPKDSMFYIEYTAMMQPQWKEALEAINELADAYEEVKASLPELSKLNGAEEIRFVKTFSESIYDLIDEILISS